MGRHRGNSFETSKSRDSLGAPSWTAKFKEQIIQTQRSANMPERSTIERAKRDAKQGKAPSTQAGEFVREEIHHVREGKHGVRSAKQAIAIGLSKARRAGVPLPPKPGTKRVAAKSSRTSSHPSAKRARATLAARKREPHAGASHTALARQAHKSAAGRSAADRHSAAMKAVRTKGASGRRQAAKKAAASRARAH